MSGGTEEEKSGSGIRTAVEALRRIPRIRVLSRPVFHDEERPWSILIEIRAMTPANYVPERTLLYVVIDESYPLGDIRFYPAKKVGLTCTFPHQAYNSAGPDKYPWREGKLCLDVPERSLGVPGMGPEPFGDAEARMLWHGERAVAWLDTASLGELLKDGDPFELPQYPPELDDEIYVYDESVTSFHQWEGVQDRAGRIFFSQCKFRKTVYAAVRFETFSGELVHQASFRENADKFPKICGTWWCWPEPIILKPWQIPATWGELRTVGERLRIDVDGTLRELAKGVRKRGERILFLGYPIPKKVGEEPTEMHWKAVRLPRLETKPPKGGFRPTDENFWERCDHRDAFGPTAEIRFVSTKNWNADRLQARGRFGDALRSAKLAVMGSGSLGSIMAEILARGGVQDILLLDDEKLDAGNLVRHVLTYDDLGENKAEAMAKRLITISPYIHAIGVKKGFPISKEKAVDLFGSRSLLVDCTGSDSLLVSLADCWWPIPRLFVSAFFGHKARRLYVFASSGNLFPLQEFRDAVEPWLLNEKELWASHEEVLEGAGCWSPLFPARYDDVVLGAATAVKVIDGLATAWPQSPQLAVFEQKDSDGFAGFHRVLPACTSARS